MIKQKLLSTPDSRRNRPSGLLRLGDLPGSSRFVRVQIGGVTVFGRVLAISFDDSRRRVKPFGIATHSVTEDISGTSHIIE